MKGKSREIDDFRGFPFDVFSFHFPITPGIRNAFLPARSDHFRNTNKVELWKSWMDAAADA